MKANFPKEKRGCAREEREGDARGREPAAVRGTHSGERYHAVRCYFSHESQPVQGCPSLNGTVICVLECVLTEEEEKNSSKWMACGWRLGKAPNQHPWSPKPWALRQAPGMEQLERPARPLPGPPQGQEWERPDQVEVPGTPTSHHAERRSARCMLSHCCSDFYLR